VDHGRFPSNKVVVKKGRKPAGAVAAAEECGIRTEFQGKGGTFSMPGPEGQGNSVGFGKRGDNAAMEAGPPPPGKICVPSDGAVRMRQQAAVVPGGLLFT